MRKPTRWIAAGDNHGSRVDPDARRAFFEFKKWWKPHHTIHGGDFVDLAALRRGASDEEANEGVKEDIEAGLSFVREMRPDCLLLGNHCDRLVRETQSGHGRLREYATLIYDQILDRLRGVQVIPYDKRIGFHDHGDARFVHGFFHGVFAARQCAQTYATGTARKAIQFHVHAHSVFDMPTVTPVTGYTVGALCDLNMPYAKSMAATLRWSSGWCYGLLLPSGETTVWMAQKVGGSYWLPSEMKAI